MLDVARHTLKMGDSIRATTVVFAGVQLAWQAHKIRRGELPDIKQDLAGQLRQLDLRFPAAIPTSAPNYRTRWLRQVRWRRAGGAPVFRAAARVTFWGALAMALTAGVGAFFGAVL